MSPLFVAEKATSSDRKDVMRVSEKEVQKLFNSDEAWDVCVWYVAERYQLIQGLIYPDGAGVKISQPLWDTNLFLGFARLAAHGLPSEKRILSWVHQHGLLRRQDYDRFRHVEDESGARQVNQKPITVEDFRKEARRAYEALTLFQDIRKKNYGVLRRRLRTEEVEYQGQDGNRRVRHITYLDDKPLLFEKALIGDYSERQALQAATNGLQYVVEQQISDVHLHFVMDTRHPDPLSSFMDLTYRPRLSPRCPDLHSALWYQFAALMSDKYPWKNCIICGMPFPQTRKDKVVCRKACQKAKERKSKNS
jgi:hypothetical protein